MSSAKSKKEKPASPQPADTNDISFGYLQLTVAIVLMFVIQFICLAAISPESRAAFLIVDVQNCFLETGSLPVPRGSEVVPTINSIRQRHQHDFDLFVLTQDWHCADHVSFASSHPGAKPFDEIVLSYNREGELCNRPPMQSRYGVDCAEQDIEHRINQTLWPDHCVMDTRGAEFSEGLAQHKDDLIIRKGWRCHIDSYSAFVDNGGFTLTDLQSKLLEQGITHLFIGGLALDYCVFWSSKDSVLLAGLKTYVIEDASRAISHSTAETIQAMKQLGIAVINSKSLPQTFSAIKHINSFTKIVQEYPWLPYMSSLVIIFLIWCSSRVHSA